MRFILLFFGWCAVFFTLPAQAHKVTAVSVASYIDTVENSWEIELAMDIDPSEEEAANEEISPIDAAVAYAKDGIVVVIDGVTQELTEPETSLIEDSDEETPEALKRRQIIAKLSGSFAEGSRELVLRADANFTPAIVLVSSIDGKRARRTMTLFPGESSRPFLLETLTPGNPFTDAAPATKPEVQTVEKPSLWSMFCAGFLAILPGNGLAAAFVGSFLFLGLRRRRLLWQVAVFIVAHSLALAVAILLQLPEVSANLLTVLTAGGVIFLALDNLLATRLRWWRLLVILIAGLAFGWQFAGNFRGGGVASLMTFNIGLEAAHLAILAVTFLVIIRFAKRQSFRQLIVLPASILAMGIAFFTLFQLW